MTSALDTVSPLTIPVACPLVASTATLFVAPNTVPMDQFGRILNVTLVPSTPRLDRSSATVSVLFAALQLTICVISPALAPENTSRKYPGAGVEAYWLSVHVAALHVSVVPLTVSATALNAVGRAMLKPRNEIALACEPPVPAIERVVKPTGSVVWANDIGVTAPKITATAAARLRKSEAFVFIGFVVSGSCCGEFVGVGKCFPDLPGHLSL